MPIAIKRRSTNPSSPLSLTSTLAFALVAFVVVAFLFFGGLLLLLYVQTHQIVIFDNQRSMAQDAARSVSGLIREKTDLLSAVIRLDAPLRLPPEKQRILLDGLLSVQPSFRSLCLMDENRKITARASRLTEQALRMFCDALERNPVFSGRAAENYVSPVHIDPLTGEPLVILAVPSIDLFREFDGYLAAEFNLKFMWEMVDRLNRRTGGEAYVVDRLGSLIAYGDAGRVLRAENVGSLRPVRDFTASSGVEGVSEAAVYQGISGDRVVGAYSALGTPDWAVVVEVVWGDAYRPVIGNVLLSFAVFFAFSVLAGVLGVLIARRLASPLVRLTETAGLIADGAGEMPVVVRGPREVAGLASAFNSMTSQLLQSRASLEAQLVEIKNGQEEKANLEQKLFQAQKMESIGRLAGGVAHDFNNMLNVILGYAELIRLDAPPRDQLLLHIGEIERAAGQARDVTRQLLAFSRKQIISPVSLDVNDLIGKNGETLARLIGEDIDLRFFPGADLWRVKLDPSQLNQIVFNLAINARDAMPDGGKLTIETANASLDETYCRDHPGYNPGDYVRLTVSDNGIGMDRETISHLFEPFFTTKEVGKGTGLGLATVYGIVKQNGGFINVYSEPGQGTSLHIYFLKDSGAAPATAKPEAKMMPAGEGVIILVEDDEMVRSITAIELEKLGYQVLPLKSPEDALSAFRQRKPAFKLLITDVIMPGMNGIELKTQIAALQPGIKVLFMSGYTANTIVHHGVLDKKLHFLQKPFTLEELARKVREAIED
ncbi:MAG: response regulator [Spirochaetales bacterium]|nr:response regulator [Spirochaetales bacterium]